METTVRQAIAATVARPDESFVLAVSGGRDSMALLYAMAKWAPRRIAAVATFDHGTGVIATQAASLVVAQARRLGVSVVRERARGLVPSEAAWRDARWEFLQRVARAYHARIATAHTRDDQLETVVQRLLRGTGVRGLAALKASSPHARPWLPLWRDEVAQWAESVGVPYVEDPTNSARRNQRSRIRHDLLPALEAACPGFAQSMLSVADKAALWRRDLEQLVDALVLAEPGVVRGRLRIAEPYVPLAGGPAIVHVHVSSMRDTTHAGRAALWPAVMARAGVRVDGRGIAQLVRFSDAQRIGAQLQLSGGAIVRRVRFAGDDLFEVDGRRSPGLSPGPWRLVPGPDAPDDRSVDPMAEPTEGAPCMPNASQASWRCQLPRSGAVTVRGWSPGDRIRTPGAPAGRRVAKYLSEAHIPSLDRPGWPVVLWESEIVWIPGVCRSVAAPNRPGWSDLIWYRCEREHG